MEAVFLSLVNRSITAGWLVLAVLALRLLLRRAPKSILCAMWGLVGLRLLCPVSIASPLSLIPSVQTLPETVLTTAQPEIYSGVAVIDRPARPDALADALARTDVSVRPLPEAIRRRRDELLDRLGVTGHEGRTYLETAVGLAWLDMRLARSLTATLYPLVGRRHGVSARKVEQSMRYAIELAWKRGRIDEQYSIFRGTIDAQRGKPTCGEMIAQLADILRIEEV